MATKTLPTCEELRRRYSYNPETGDIVWRISRMKARPGDVIRTTNGSGYVIVGVNGTMVPGHRLIWCIVTGEWPKEHIDHINGVRNDNRWVNLREATLRQNNLNRPTVRDPELRGLEFHHGAWRARIKVHGKTIGLGSYPTQAQAREAYKKAAAEHFGEFAHKEKP